jgi:hypothetical protein
MQHSPTETGIAMQRSDHATDEPAADSGRFVENLMHFARALRAAGVPVGPGRVLDALRAVQAVGIGNRDDFYWALHASFVNRRDQHELFDQAFHIFWRNPKLLERMMAMLLPQMRGPAAEQDREEMHRRLAEAFGAKDPAEGAGLDDGEDEKIEFDAALTYSDRERLQAMDFEKMSAAEIAAAKRLISAMRLPIMQVPTRRHRPDRTGARIDMRNTLRAGLRSVDSIVLRRREACRRHPPLVILCDISGSMSRYARIALHFMHAITSDRDRVHTFLFGTRLTNITRHLRHRDIDLALEKIGGTVQDWSGGTRIGRCLEEFNNRWSRRVLGQGAVVLFISDGLDRDDAVGLERQMERLHKSCRRLIWLNPLLRYEGFAPLAKGARAIMPHVDDFRPVHDLRSLADLTRVLSQPPRRRLEARHDWVA